MDQDPVQQSHGHDHRSYAQVKACDRVFDQDRGARIPVRITSIPTVVNTAANAAVADLRLVGARLVCDRDEGVPAPVLPRPTG